jgi:hypothetical protein
MAIFVSCDLWNDKHALVYFQGDCYVVQQAGGIRMRVSMVLLLLLLMCLSPPLRGAGPMALMLGNDTHLYQQMFSAFLCTAVWTARLLTHSTEGDELRGRMGDGSGGVVLLICRTM